MNAQPFPDLIRQFAGLTVVVLGDAMVDHYVMGRVNRTSAEAPVPIHHAYGEEFVAGGAANVARNMAAQGARVRFISVVGKDAGAGRLTQILTSDPLIEARLVEDPTRPTTVKTRFVAKGQQMLRVDWEKAEPVSADLRQALLKELAGALQGASGLVISDYGKGVVSQELVQEAVRLADAQEVEILVDPKGRDYTKYRGVACVTPNRKEAEEASGILIRDEESARRAAEVLQDAVQGKAICITLSAGGVAIYPKGEPAQRVAASAKEVFDVTGAGDTFLAVMALARFAGTDFGRSVELGNLAAGIAVGRSGVAVISSTDLLASLSGTGSGQKWLSPESLREKCRSLRLAGRKLVFTNGCFDLLTAGHIRLLERSRTLGDVLILALNDDAGVKRLKGEGRPHLPLNERVEILSALGFVDFLTVFSEDTPNDLLRSLQPDVLVKGNTGEDVVGREIVESYGGRIEVLDVSHSNS
ncbi:MAG: bifunctional heptose 7-phosphate kinase/heptose 1-phosphate adenyltransferase [Candidatus Sumerlaeia bacterium]|nr:bifunctional heptose 7-phosphate kinase/heptose 1-phosphate adenyltransferase [Candidatus Sumerlaeia bacterium]